MSNRLADETSPYLLQHADNPVDWYPWGAEAFRTARELRRPILLSIGYSACHWCHVMARESFSDPATASYMNGHFVNVKVDREERPDVDAVYMSALQAMTGSGGWPLTALLTPEGKPFFAGTYWPPEPRHGLPAFSQVLAAAVRAWTENPDEVAHTAADLTGHLKQQLAASLKRGPLQPETGSIGLARLLELFDSEHGGFGSKPKFPPHSVLQFLLARPEQAARDAALLTMRNMARGGIFDQLGGGLSRYTVDEAWLVPHFEKMLFDSAQFLGLSAAAWTHSHEAGFLRAARLTVDWLKNDLLADSGAFMSARSAESEGIEGRHYVWDAGEIEAALGDPELAGFARAAFQVSDAGNFEGRNILSLSAAAWQHAGDPRLEQVRQQLLAHRSERPAPELDDKVLTSWNGLAIGNLSLAGRLLQQPDWIRLAGRAAAVFEPDLLAGRLRHSLSGGSTLLLEDLAFLGNGLLGLYNATLEPRWLEGARSAALQVRDRFSQDGNLFSTAEDAEELLLRPRDLADSGAPADIAEATRLLLRIGRLTDDDSLLRLVQATLESSAAPAQVQPTLMGSTLSVVDEWFAPALEVVLNGDRTSQEFAGLAGAVQTRYLPRALLLHESAGADRYPALKDRSALAGRPTAWVCFDRACRLPAHTPADLAAQLPENAPAER